MSTLKDIGFRVVAVALLETLTILAKNGMIKQKSETVLRNIYIVKTLTSNSLNDKARTLFQNHGSQQCQICLTSLDTNS